MRTTLILCALFILSACGGKWTHPQKTEADFNRDRADCENVIVTKHGGWSRVEPFTASMEINDCLRTKGYTKG